jgi:hypothetical protein
MSSKSNGSHHQDSRPNQSGLGTFAMIGALVGLGVVFLTVFFIANSSPKVTTKSSTATQTTPSATDTTAPKEPPFIRIPENSKVYSNSSYKFMFSYPDSFGDLTDSSAVSGTVLFRAESALAAQKPVGNGKAVMNGKFGAYLYKKSDFKIVIQLPDVSVAPTKTGNDTTWKIVSRGTTGQDISIGDSYPVKTVKSQTGIPVFDFGLKNSNTLLGRWVFEAGDNYILIAMPTVSKTDNSPLTDADLAAYNVIGSNIASTVRLPSTVPTASSTTSGSNAGGTTTPTPPTSSSTNSTTSN